MRKVKVITDSCADMPKSLLDRYDIDYAQMNTVYKGETSPADLGWTKEEAHRFYDLQRKGERITTTQVPVEEFNRVFRKYLDEGCDIVYVACSSKQSGSVNTAAVLAKKLKEEYPDAEIHCIDALRSCTGEGILAVETAKYAAEGHSAEECAKYCMDLRNHVRQFITVHSLDALKRAGRVKASAAFFGNLMGVKPILVADANGVQTGIKKVKGRAASLQEIVNCAKEVIENPEEQTVYLCHADCAEEEVRKLKDLVKEAIPCKEIVETYIGPIVGASIGPDAIGLYCIGKEMTYKVAE